MDRGHRVVQQACPFARLTAVRPTRSKHPGVVPCRLATKEREVRVRGIEQELAHGGN